jgi:hypothetical protein
MECSMAKKDKKDSKTAKPRKGKLPKEIAGIKIPKELRKTGEALIATANSPAGRSLLISGASAMMATMASQMRSAGQPGSAPHTAPPAPPRTPETNDHGQVGSQPGGQPGFDAEAAGAQVARRIIEVIGIAANASKRPRGTDSSGG